MSEHRLEYLALAAHLSSVGDARRFLSTIAAECAVPPETVDVGMLAVSELVTNALLHGTPPVEVQIDVTTDLMRVEVLDASDRRPEIVPAAPATSDRGRGLAIVEALTDDWGYHGRADAPGKTVWFELRRL